MEAQGEREVEASPFPSYRLVLRLSVLYQGMGVEGLRDSVGFRDVRFLV